MTKNAKPKEISLMLVEELAEEVKLINVEKKITWTKNFIIATAQNKTHLRTLRENAKIWLKKNGFNGIIPEGSKAESEWTLLDLGDTIIHLMTPAARDYWDIDGLVEGCLIVYES
ncbi:ribosome silencing factor [bacterium]|nr:ribosome silencing factor [bacterium]|tara:strand:- start:8597 stop:8941 length:345 start_codon:yes stop_codon:yes gene_type:complete